MKNNWTVIDKCNYYFYFKKFYFKAELSYEKVCDIL